MNIIDPQGRVFGRVNIVDFILGLTICLAVIGIFLVQSGMHVTSGEVVEGETDILITVYIKELKTLDPALFVKGKKTSITIRNQPRGEVLIESAQNTPVKVTIVSQDGKIEAVDDLAQPNSFDYVVNLQDHAKITSDGYVTEGVKAKIGLPIELEGFKYRVYGKIINIKPLQ